VLDLVREVRPPFSPETVCTEFATAIRAYGLSEAIGDRWGGQFPVEAMRKLGIRVRPSERTKSDIYRELVPLVNSGRVELLDHPRLLAQLAALERRTARGGKDSIDHPPGSHDDLANVAAGSLVLAAARPSPLIAFIPANAPPMLEKFPVDEHGIVDVLRVMCERDDGTEWQDKYYFPDRPPRHGRVQRALNARIRQQQSLRAEKVRQLKGDRQ
jgi:hypothetical protein